MTAETSTVPVVGKKVDNDIVDEIVDKTTQIDFSEEEANLAASDPSLDMGEKVAEEEASLDDATTVTAMTDFSGKSKQELVDILTDLLQNRSIQSLRSDVEAVKVAFYKVHRAEIEAQKKSFVEAGGLLEEFAPESDQTEQRLKELFVVYRTKRDEFLAMLEGDKEKNYQSKLAIIEELKELLTSSETVNHTFNQFRELQTRWREIGSVPASTVKDLWETYNLHVENFYSFIKINKELRDLDLKKNYELKNSLCEQAEALILETSVIDSFRKLQKLHDQWRETGPVAMELKEQLWSRFREASTQVNKRHQDYFDNIKVEQTANLTLKEELCVKTEELCSRVMTTRKEWLKASEQLIEIQKVWKTIGFAPKKDNAKIYERFRAACDKFFELKREFYLRIKSEMDHNLELKNEICALAESMKDSTDWKKTTDELIALQKKWKEITGPVPRRFSDQVWKRFRAACDYFFECKSKHFSGVEQEHTANLEKKQALLSEISTFIESGEQITFDVVKAFQRRWTEIGFVPIKQKDSVAEQYRKLIDKLFATLRSGDRNRGMEKFKDRVSTMQNNGGKGVRYEKERLMTKLKQLETEVSVLENNIGFFSQSKGAESMIESVKNKIAKTREQMKLVSDKLAILNSQEA
ncbi:MAG: DUF349 domain-containing protein [Rikenellaceae bacterium]